MATIELDKLIALIDTLSEADRQKLAEHLAGQPPTNQDFDDSAFSEEEINDMMNIQPASGREIVQEGVRSGAIGSWADKGIADPVEWLKQQRKSRYQW